MNPGASSYQVCQDLQVSLCSSRAQDTTCRLCHLARGTLVRSPNQLRCDPTLNSWAPGWWEESGGWGASRSWQQLKEGAHADPPTEEETDTQWASSDWSGPRSL